MPRFENYRFIGLRDTMRAYDCDDPFQYEEVSGRIADEGLVAVNLVQTFAPDTVEEARNRGFTEVGRIA